jgi:hypothetical protein
MEEKINASRIRSLTSKAARAKRHHHRIRTLLDMETAGHDVRDKVSQAQRYSKDCDPPTVTKTGADRQPYQQVTVQSDKRSLW